MKTPLWLRILVVYFLITFVLCVSLVASLTGILQKKGLLNDQLFQEIVGQSLGVFFLGFFVAFVISVAYNRRFIKAIRDLKEASDRVREGDLTVTLPVEGKDELSDVEEAFNLMVKSLREKTDDLKRKELYVNTMMDALWVVDRDNVIIDINPAFTKLFGYTKEEALGSSIFDFIDEQDRASVRAELRKRDRELIHSTYRAHITTKDGQRLPVLITGAPIVEDGEVIAKIGIIKDISTQEKLLREITDAREQLESIIDAISDALVVIDRNYRIIKANASAKARYGEEMIGSLCYELLHENPVACWEKGVDCPLEKALSERQDSTKTLHVHINQKGTDVYEEILATPVTDRVGEVVYIVEVLRDVTERVIQERELHRKTRQQQLINSVVSICTTSLNPEEVFSKTLEKLVEEFEMDGGGVFFIDERRKTLYCRFHKGVPEGFVEKAGVVSLGEDIPGRVALTGEPIFSPDISRDERITRTAVKEAGMKGYCCIPMRGKGVISGVVCLFSYRERPFTPEQQQVLQSIGEMIGLALENMRFYEKLRSLYEEQKLRQTREQETLHKMTSSLSTASGIEDVIKRGCAVIEAYLYADATLFFEKTVNGTLMLRYWNKFSPQKREFSFEELGIDETVLIQQGMAVRFEALFVSEKRFNMVLFIPVSADEELFGIMVFLFSMHRDIQDEERHFLGILKGIFSVSYERSLFYERMIIERGLAEATLNSIKDGVFTVDRSGKVLSANRALSTITGRVITNIVGRHYRDFIDFLKDVTVIERALQGQIPEPEVVEWGQPEVVYQIVASPLMDPMNVPYGAVCVIRDITKEREIDRMKTEIIRSVSHEFRTPLSAIIGMTEMVLEGDVTGDKVQTYLNTVIKEGKRLASMVTDLLDISKLESGSIVPKFEEVDLQGLIQSVIERFQLRIKEKNAKVSVKVQKALKNFLTDRELLFKVLSNLVDNSLKYSDPGCKIKIKASSGNGYVIITVEDTGWGIPANELKRVGERFFRGVHGTRTKGTGLGISLCRQMLEQIGGSLEIDSVYGKGTTVRVILKKIGPGGQ
ncbi:MAG: PAS domain S-box protein [Nitrospirae bacterium]|nr:MAG: PAS domain S-box protein [Nitrospirota bacterium]